MATHGLIIVAMKADNELSISVLLYFKSVKKWKFVLRKTKQNKTTPPPKKKKKNGKKMFPMAWVEPLTFDV